MPNQHSPSEGLSIRELVLEVRKDIRKLDEKFDREIEKTQKEIQRVDKDISRRPTRAEVLSILAISISVAGVVLA